MPVIFTALLITIPLVVLLELERKYSPRIDITKEWDVFLWYNKGTGRTYKWLFNVFYKKD